MRAHLPRAQRDDWGTPDSIFLPRHEEFGFTLDAAASAHNAKCPRFFDKETDALQQRWDGVVWCNPPYGHDTTWRFVKKGYEESLLGSVVCMLVPAYTASGWWHDWAMRGEVRFIRGKIRFVGASDRAMFASAFVIYR